MEHNYGSISVFRLVCLTEIKLKQQNYSLMQRVLIWLKWCTVYDTQEHDHKHSKDLQQIFRVVFAFRILCKVRKNLWQKTAPIVSCNHIAQHLLEKKTAAHRDHNFSKHFGVCVRRFVRNVCSNLSGFIMLSTTATKDVNSDQPNKWATLYVSVVWLLFGVCSARDTQPPLLQLNGSRYNAPSYTQLGFECLGWYTI